MEAKFGVMNKLRVTSSSGLVYEGYAIDSQFKDSRWIYKLSISEDPRKMDSFDNWVPEEWCVLTK